MQFRRPDLTQVNALSRDCPKHVRDRQIEETKDEKGTGLALAMLSAVLTATTIPAIATGAELRHEAALRDFHGRDFRTFSRIERDQWRGGHWLHSWHNGRFGWWWAVGPYWYFYNRPVYPYPVYVPPLVQAPPVVVPPSGAPAAWYYCDNPQGYYPYVATCNGPWRTVPGGPGAVPPTTG